MWLKPFLAWFGWWDKKKIFCLWQQVVTAMYLMMGNHTLKWRWLLSMSRVRLIRLLKLFSWLICFENWDLQLSDSDEMRQWVGFICDSLMFSIWLGLSWHWDLRGIEWIRDKRTECFRALYWSYFSICSIQSFLLVSAFFDFVYVQFRWQWPFGKKLKLSLIR